MARIEREAEAELKHVHSPAPDKVYMKTLRDMERLTYIDPQAVKTFALELA